MKLRTIARVLRRIIGAPDYAAYIANFRQRHPGETPLDARAFRQRQLELRYSRPGARCC